MHVAIIPDGNRRWAKQQGLASSIGHERSAQFENMMALMRKSKELGIDYVSLWVFSTENWKRSEQEQKILFRLLCDRVKDLKEHAHEEGIRVRWVGRRDRVPQAIATELTAVEEMTKDEKALNFQLCLDYGGHDEILRAANAAVRAGKEVTEEEFAGLLDTHGLPAVDLIIRTSGEQRLSGFMPWLGAYAELYFCQKHFPEFTPDDLAAAVRSFAGRHRRFGGD